MNKKQAMAMLKFISELYEIIAAPEPQTTASPYRQDNNHTMITVPVES